jgi:hypothetical protein
MLGSSIISSTTELSKKPKKRKNLVGARIKSEDKDKKKKKQQDQVENNP